jgi:hypothetical protein
LNYDSPENHRNGHNKLKMLQYIMRIQNENINEGCAKKIIELKSLVDVFNSQGIALGEIE